MTDGDRIGHRARRGVKWNLLGALATNGMRVVVVAVLGRTLDSKDFGVVAAAISVNAVLYSIRDIGVGLALVQRKDLDREHQSTAFAVSLYLGVALSVLIAAGAPIIAQLYHIEDSTDVLRVLGLLFTLRGVSATSRMICQRAMRFRAIAVIETGGFLAGSATSMILALLAFGPWALVAGYLVEEAIGTLGYLASAPPPISLRVDKRRFRELMTFGTGQTISQIAGVVAIYGDNFVVGHVRGPEALGFYSRAYDLIKLPSLVFANIVGSVLFPAFSKLQNDRPRLAAGFRRMTFLNALVLLPASAALIILAPEAIRILMGDGWESAVLPFQILAVSMYMRTGQKLGAIVATAANAVNGIAVAYVIFAAFVAGGAALSIRWGIAGVAVTTGIAILVSNIECAYLAMRVSGLGTLELLRAHLPGLGLTVLVVAFAAPITALLRDSLVPAAITFTLVALGSVVIAGGAAAIGLRRGTNDFGWLRGEIGRFVRRSPA